MLARPGGGLEYHGTEEVRDLLISQNEFVLNLLIFACSTYDHLAERSKALV